METHGDEVHVSTAEARAGDTPHVVRYVLAISLVLAIAALSLVWITGALTTDSPPPPLEVRAAPATTG